MVDVTLLTLRVHFQLKLAEHTLHLGKIKVRLHSHHKLLQNLFVTRPSVLPPIGFHYRFMLCNLHK